jgi:RNA polymerase sigma-70 factor (ECF subfamily)
LNEQSPKVGPDLSRPADIAEFIDVHYDDVYRFLRHLTRHVQEAEDLTQQTFIRAVRSFGTYDPGSSSKRTWLHRIAYREFLNWRRGRKILMALDPRLSRSDRRLESIVDSEALLAMLERIGPVFASVFLLIEVQEMSHAESAEVLGIPVGTVKSRLHEAKRKLRQIATDSMESRFEPVTEAYEH